MSQSCFFGGVFLKGNEELSTERKQENSAKRVGAIYSRASAEEESRKKHKQQDEESCKAMTGSVGSLMDAEGA